MVGGLRTFAAMILAVATLGWAVTGADAVTLAAGPYLFSDQLDGARLISVGGTGATDDPIAIVEEFADIAPAVLTIARLPAEDPTALSVPVRAPPYLHMELIVANHSGRAWIGFELELEEIRGEPSTYRDGLSFDQISKNADRLTSDRFARGNRTFEPGDRIMFWGGAVDAGQTVRFSLLITDTSPSGTFYLVQRPQLATASLGADPVRAASLDPAALSLLTTSPAQR